MRWESWEKLLGTAEREAGDLPGRGARGSGSGSRLRGLGWEEVSSPAWGISVGTPPLPLPHFLLSSPKDGTQKARLGAPPLLQRQDY